MNQFLNKSGTFLGYSLLGIMLFLNFSSGIISGIWLLAIGMWPVVIQGILYSIAMPFVYSIAAIPSLILVAPLTKFADSGNKVMVAFFGFLNVFYSNLLILFWVYFVFNGIVSTAIGITAIPLILWGYSTVLGPLGYMAKNEQGSTGTALGIFFAQLSYIVIVILWLSGSAQNTSYVAIGAITLLFTLIPTWIAVHLTQETTTQVNHFNESNIINEAEVEEEEGKICIECGGEISPEAEYCRYCGIKN